MGTNTFHLLIADVSGGKPTILHQQKIAARIGVGGMEQAHITEAAWSRAHSALRLFQEEAERWQVHRMMALGTSAIRNAANGKDFIDFIHRELGFEAAVISGDEEARFIAMGVKSAIAMGSTPHLIMDIGGGSVEFIIADQQQNYWAQSFEIGGQRLLEKFKPTDPITAAERDALHQYFQAELQPLSAAVQKLQPPYLAGSSGSFDTLSEMYCHDVGLHYNPQHGNTPFSKSYFYEVYPKITALPRAARLAMPGMIEMRVDMIVVACALIDYVLSLHHFADIKVSSFSLKEGVLYSLSLPAA